jgi:hypothetical protein
MKSEKSKTIRNAIIIAVVTICVVGVVYLSRPVEMPTQKITKVIENTKFSK